MKQKYYLLLLLLSIFSPAHAVEEWEGHFRHPQWPQNINVIAYIDKTPEGVLNGTVTLTGSRMRCGGDAKIESGQIVGNSINIKTEPYSTHDCGRFRFEGNIVNGLWVGKVPWAGHQNDITLKQVK